MTCTGIHTRYVLEAPASFRCGNCRALSSTESGPTPKLCDACARKRGACQQCAQPLDEADE